METPLKKALQVATTIAVLALLPAAALAQEQTYVLTASGWGAAQAAAVEAASGTVVFGHDGAGVGVATASAPDFAARVRKSKSITSVEADRMVQWQLPNGVGTIGIAPQATLVGVKVLHNGSGSFGGVIQGILYASTPLAQGGGGADIINMSLGAVFPKNASGAGPLVAAMNKAVNYANRTGVLGVSAVGNDGLDLDHRGNLISVLAQSGAGVAVSATGPVGFAYGAMDFDRPASYTNYGTSAINVAAPGGDFAYPGNELCTLPRTPSGSVTIPCWAFDMVLSTSRGSGASISAYSWAAGTSMAAPAASAVAAIIKQQNPGISLGALKTALQNSATDAGKKGADPFYGKGWVNALRACQQ